MAKIFIRLDVKLFCPGCKRESYRWWIDFDLDKEGTYYYTCMGCKISLWTLIIEDGNIRVYDSKTKYPVGFTAKTV
jgi:hypothetical protein